MRLNSPEFADKDMIPIKFTCDGENINPPLQCEQIPYGTASLVLICDDPDAPSGLYTHWIVFDIAPNTSIEQNSIPGKQGTNTAGQISYFGPCPPKNQRHRYYFRMYALNQLLNIPVGSTRVKIEKAMEGHVLASAELMGYYR